METEILSALSGGADAATIAIAMALFDVRRRLSQVEDKMLYILTELAKRGSVSHQFSDRS
ncbi:hypothetical protein ORI99_01845 [Alishewanella sp. SMS9]|nr:hypothetical protein [Alishewanella sp. SMS9]